MRAVNSFEYATLRVVPKVEREEFINVGVILYCRPLKFLQVRIFLDETKLHALSSTTDVDEVKRHLSAFEEIARGTAKESAISKLDIASRFRWLTATRSTIVQSSKVHTGMCEDPVRAIENLFLKLVL